MPLVHIRSAVDKKLEDIAQHAQSGTPIGLSTGILPLDNVLGGLRKKAVYIIAGRTGMGKSALAYSISMNVANAGKKVLYLSMEMDADIMATRYLTAYLGESASTIENDLLTADKQKKLQDHLEHLSSIPLMLLDGPHNSEEFMVWCKEYQENHGLDLLCVDYIGLFRDKNTFGETERMQRMSGNIAALAHICDIPILNLAQLNREVEKRENHMPMLSDLRSSGDLEQDAYGVIFAYRPHYYEMMHNRAPDVPIEHDAQLIIAKHKNGPTGMVGVPFYPGPMMWRSNDVEPGSIPKVS